MRAIGSRDVFAFVCLRWSEFLVWQSLSNVPSWRGCPPDCAARLQRGEISGYGSDRGTWSAGQGGPRTTATSSQVEPRTKPTCTVIAQRRCQPRLFLHRRSIFSNNPTMPTLTRGFYVPQRFGALGLSCREGSTSQNGATSGSATMTRLSATKTTGDSALAPKGDYMEEERKEEL